MFEYYGNIHVYCPGVWAYEPLGPFFSESLILGKIFTSNDYLKVFLKRSRSPQGHDLYTHCSTSAIGASCQVSLKSVHQIRRRRFLKGFYLIWQPSWSCELDNLYIHQFPHSIDASHKIWL